MEHAKLSPVTIQNLRCEYQVDPLGLDTSVPRLSWTLQAEARGWTQSAYQIRVASHPKQLTAGNGDLWDSGKILSNATAQIEYQGPPLTARQECVWQVCVWDAAGAPSAWSAIARWEMGLLTEDDWGGSAWIGRATDDAPAPYLRREFTLTSPIRKARITACGLGYADLFVNGHRIGGDTERDPAYTDFTKRVLSVTHDVTALLTPGPNALGAVLGTGWFDVHDEAVWNFDKAPWRGPRRLRLVLHLDYTDGRQQTVVSNKTWKLGSGPLRRDGIYTGEIYDARLEMPGWNESGFDDTSWEPAALLSFPAGKLAARVCPPIAVTQTLAPVGITEPKPGVFVADFGQNFSGHVRLRVQAPAGTTITLRYGEKLHADGTLDPTNIDHFMTVTTPPQPFQSDTYICKGGGEEVWEQRFSYSGFQYAEVHGFPGRPTAHHLEGRFAHTHFETAGEFSCSDPMLNKIQEATRWAYLSNAQSIPTDCPQREKNGWTGDAHLAAEAGLMNFNAASFYTKWLDDFADSQLSDGRPALIIPTGGWGRGECHPAWDSAFPIIVWDMYRYCGDRRLLARHYEPIRRYVDYLMGRTESGVVPFDSLGDWLPWEAETPSQLTSTIFLFHDLQLLTRIAHFLGHTTDAEKYEALAAQTRDAIQAKWFDPAHSTYANGSQTALAMPLFFGVTPDDQRDAVFAALVAVLEKQGHIDTGILGAKYALRVLTEGGRADLVYRLITRPEQPSWAWWIGQGATTLWEDWKGEASLNHIMFGDVSNWFFQWVAGIGLDPDAPGFTQIRIQPQLVGGLTWARACYESIHGSIISDWKHESGVFHLNVTIPANTTATVQLPLSGPSQITEGNLPAESASGVRLLRQELDHAVFTVGSGTYAFTATPR